jgi:hypothetical protein
MASLKRLTANRNNATRSTGPVTPAGKTRSSQNATTHGLTSKAVLLPGEDAAEYERAKAALLRDLRPSTEAEQLQAERVADHWWRLERLYKAETSLFSNRIEAVAAAGTSSADGIAALFVDPEEMQRMRLFLRYLTAAERTYNKALADYKAMQKANAEAAEEEHRETAGPSFLESLEAALNAPIPGADGFVSYMSEDLPTEDDLNDLPSAA